MDNIVKTIIEDNVQARYNILIKAEGLKVYPLVRDYLEVVMDKNYNLFVKVNTSNGKIRQQVRDSFTSVQSDIDAYNKDCLILNEFLHGLQGQDQVEALEHMARCCEKSYIQFNSTFVNYLKGKNLLKQSFKGNLPMRTLFANKVPYSLTGVVLEIAKEFSLHQFQTAWIDLQEKVKQENND